MLLLLPLSTLLLPRRSVGRRVPATSQSPSPSTAPFISMISCCSRCSCSCFCCWFHLARDAFVTAAADAAAAAATVAGSGGISSPFSSHLLSPPRPVSGAPAATCNPVAAGVAAVSPPPVRFLREEGRPQRRSCRRRATVSISWRASFAAAARRRRKSTLRSSFSSFAC